MSQGKRVLGAITGLLLLSLILSSCGATPVAENWPGLTQAEGALFAISGAPQQVYRLDAETGTQKGTFLPQGDHRGIAYWSPVAVGGGLAYVGFSDSISGLAGLYAFDPETGQEQWNIPAESLILPAPVYADGVVYFASSDGRVYAVDVESRTVKPGWPFQTQEAVWASPLVVGNRVYVASQDHFLYCLDAETAQEIWKAEVGGAMAAQPTFDETRGVVYVGAFDGRVYAIEADSGQLVDGFEFQAENWIWSEVLLDADLLYVTSLDGKLYALEPETGAVAPPYPFDSGTVGDKDSRIRAAPIKAGDSIVVATESGRVISVRDGQVRWSWPGGTPAAGILTTPVLSGETLYVILQNGQVQALNAENGGQGWTFTPPQAQ